MLRTTQDYLGLIAGEEPAFPPGTQTRYGNSGFLLLAAAVERASGEDYYDYVRDHVAHPERRTDNIFQYPVRGSGATGLYASAPEVIAFGLELRAGTLLSPASVDLMLASPETGGPGYGTQRVRCSQSLAVGHGGRAFGAATTLLFLPEVEHSVCILSNYDRPADKLVFAEIDRIIALG